MGDNAGDQSSITQAIEAARKQREWWLASLPAGWFGFGEVRHDPPWHIHRGDWQGDDDVPRGGYHQMTSLCGKELGRRLKRPVRAADDICWWCVVAVRAIQDSLA